MQVSIYVRDRRHLTYLKEYASMRAPTFTMYTWMMERLTDSENTRAVTFAIDDCDGEAGGFHEGFASFIFEHEGQSLCAE